MQLRTCPTFGKELHRPFAGHNRFSWYGDGRNVAAQALVRKINDEGRPLGSHRPAWSELSITAVSQLLDMGEQAYPSCYRS